MIALITAVLEIGLQLFGFFRRRSVKKEAMNELMKEFAKKHDDVVRQNLKLRNEYDKIKKRLEEDSNKDLPK